MIKVNALGDDCPIPIVKTKHAIRELNGPGMVETLVDNEIAVQNLTKMANQKKYGVKSEKLGDAEFRVTMMIGEGVAIPEVSENETCLVTPGRKKKVVVVISSAAMGVGSDELGVSLMKGFLYALSQQEEPTAV